MPLAGASPVHMRLWGVGHRRARRHAAKRERGRRGDNRHGGMREPFEVEVFERHFIPFLHGAVMGWRPHSESRLCAQGRMPWGMHDRVAPVEEKNDDGRIRSLDGLRGVAALAVVAYHYTGGYLHRLLPGRAVRRLVLHPERARALHCPIARRGWGVRLAALPTAPRRQARHPHLHGGRALLRRLLYLLMKRPATMLSRRLGR